MSLVSLHYHLLQEHSVTLFCKNIFRQEKVNLIPSLIWKKEVVVWLIVLDISPLYGAKTKTSMLMSFVKPLSRSSYSFYRGLKPINHMELGSASKCVDSLTLAFCESFANYWILMLGRRAIIWSCCNSLGHKYGSQ